MFGANSFNTCLHAPHGGVGSLSSVAMAISSKSVSPCETAEATARVSAQIASPYAEFSMLQPVITSPLLVRSAAPTRKFEYGAYALSSARRAASRREAFCPDSRFTLQPALRETFYHDPEMRGQTIPQRSRRGRRMSRARQDLAGLRACRQRAKARTLARDPWME